MAHRTHKTIVFLEFPVMHGLLLRDPDIPGNALRINYGKAHMAHSTHKTIVFALVIKCSRVC